ncbi:hypothetical protein D3C87_601150 [compost metagenome]
MKATCPLSGLTFELPEIKFHKELSAPHPFLSYPLNEVLGFMLPRFSKQELADYELHLLGTYLVYKLPVERWGHPLLSKESFSYWTSFWLANIQSLAATVKRLDGKKPKDLPTFNVFSETGDKPLSNLPEWLKSANQCINDFYAPISDEAHKRNKEFRANLSEEQFSSEAQCNAVIEKILRGSLSTPREKQKFPELIANWAAKVGDFPNSIFRDSKGERKTVRNFWKEIIANAFDLGTSGKGYSNILTSDVTIADLEELQEHCQENIPCGTLQSRALWEELDKLKEVIQEFKSPSRASDLSIEILTNQDIESILGEVSHLPHAPIKENDDPDMPRKEDYPTLSSFVKAKMAYKNLKASEGVK